MLSQFAAMNPVPIANPMRVLIGKLSNNKRLAAAFGVGVLNQTISSLTNFALSIYLARLLSPGEFGLYGVGMAISLFYAGVGNSLFLTQMVVHAPDKSPEERRPFAASVLALVVAFLAVSVVVVGVACISWFTISNEAAKYVSLILAISIAASSFLLKDFFVRYAYNALQEWEVFRVNGALAVSLLVALVVFNFFSVEVDAVSGLYIYSIAHLVAAIFGFVRSQLPVSKVRPVYLKQCWGESWGLGKWALLQNLLYTLRTQVQTYVGLFAVGPVAVGLINAARLLVTPVLFLIPSVSQILTPRLVRLRHNPGRVLRFTNVCGLGLFALAGLYSLVVLMVFPWLIDGLFEQGYQQHPDFYAITCVWCAITCVQVIQGCYGSLIQAMKMFKRWVFMNSLSAVLALLTAILVGKMVGGAGVLSGLLVSELALLAMTTTALRTASKSS